MSAEPRFEVWLHALTGTPGESASEGLSRVFGIPVQTAQEVVLALPCVVKRDADIGLATRIVGALESIGGRAECKRMSQAPGSGAPHAAATEALSTAATLKLGTQDLHALLPNAWAASVRVPGSAPAPAPMSAPPPVRAAAPIKSRAPHSGPSSTPATALELAHAPTALPVPAPRVPPRPIDAPAPQREPVLALELGAQGPVAPLHPLEVSRRARERVSLRAPELFGAAGAPSAPAPAAPQSLPVPVPAFETPASTAGADSSVFEHGVALQPQQAWQHPLQLPTSEPSATAPRMRAPSERARDPQRRSAAVSIPAHRRAGASSTANPVNAALSIWQDAEKSGWRSALHGHPVAGFLLVLGTTSAAFLLLIAAL